MNSKNSLLGWLSLAVAIVGVSIPFLLMGLSDYLHNLLWVYGPLVIWAFELIALVIGFISRRTVAGKAGMIAAVLISLLLVGYLTIGGVSTTISPTK